MLWSVIIKIFNQSAGNRFTLFSLIKTSSSETRRKTAFNFRAFESEYAKVRNGRSVNTAWLAWFIFIVEGDGSLVTWSRNGHMECQLVITQKEL